MNSFPLFLGPCVLESLEKSLEIAESILETTKPYGDTFKVYFKGSFDKANRSSRESFRGLGPERGLEILAAVKKKTSLPVITDYHLPQQAEEVASVVDVLQVPAFLCRQTDMINAGAQACKKYQRILKVKKGQFLAPQDTKNIAHKVEAFLDREHFYLTERGVSFGYGQLVVDMSSFQVMRPWCGRVIYDATHSVQRPGGLGTQTGGHRAYIENLTYAAISAGAQGLFLEVYPDNEVSPSDAATVYPLGKLAALLAQVHRLLQVQKAN